MDASTLEALFREHRIPRRLLYPLDYRLLRRCGLPMRPPVMQSLAEHYLYSVPTLVIVMIALTKLSQWLTGGPSLQALPILGVATVLPLCIWLRYQFIRRRIGLPTV